MYIEHVTDPTLLSYNLYETQIAKYVLTDRFSWVQEYFTKKLQLYKIEFIISRLIKFLTNELFRNEICPESHVYIYDYVRGRFGIVSNMMTQDVQFCSPPWWAWQRHIGAQAHKPVVLSCCAMSHDWLNKHIMSPIYLVVWHNPNKD